MPLALGATLARAQMAPFVIPSEFPADSPIACRPPPVAAGGPRVTVENGHFALGGARYRVWGVNTCFGADVPTHEDAEIMARRMAALGINSVRIHHLDTQAFPSGILDPADHLRLHPEALDRLDYFVDQLARNGIRVNLNLHVGREASRALKLPATLGYDKMAGIFTPALVEAQRQYARDLLTHTNRYRGVTYAADAAVAFVEITNEDSLFMWGADGQLRSLPPCYAEGAGQRHTAWLRDRYRTADALRKAWDVGSEPLGQEMLAAGIASEASQAGWRLEVHAPSDAALAADPEYPGRMKTSVRNADSVNWHVQLRQGPLAVEAGRYYTLAYRARASRDCSLTAGVSMDHEPWTGLGLWHQTRLSTNWCETVVGWTASASDAQARVSFALAGVEAEIEIEAVSLRPGGRIGLAANESLKDGTVRLFAAQETEARARDRLRFLAETEKDYFDGMRRFIRKDLGCGALVAGTVVFGPLGLYAQSGMDFIDTHAYWQHPHFPGRPWDSANWTVEQKAMVDEKSPGMLAGLACSRLAGKPFTVSEYNHCAPNDYQAECVPVAASTAAAQDWDGIWFFAYSHRTGDARRESFSSFFDMDANPAKLGFLRAGAALYRDGGAAPLAETAVAGIAGDGDTLARLADLQTRFGHGMRSVFDAVANTDASAGVLAKRLAVTWARGEPPPEVPGAVGTAIERAGGRGTGSFLLESEGGLAWAGWSARSPAPMLAVAAPAFAAVMVTPLDGRPWAESERLLVSACGRCENTGMAFSADRRTVGREWGKPPVCIEPVTGSVSLPTGRWRAWALGPDGHKRDEARVDVSPAGSPRLALDAARGTLWHLAERQP
jgi:hypothetical protein